MVLRAVIYCPDFIPGLRPITECKPAVLMKITNRSIIDILICKLIGEGIEYIDIISGLMSEEIYEYCNKKNYNAFVNYYNISEFIKDSEYIENIDSKEDIIFIKGNVIFEFSVLDSINFHRSSFSDITACVSDMGEINDSLYFKSDVDSEIIRTCNIKYINENEFTYSDTGIYILKGKFLKMFVNGIYSESSQFFDGIIISELRFMCCPVNGFYYKITDTESLFNITHDILDKKLSIVPAGTIMDFDMITSEGAEIKAPCLFGENFVIRQGAKIGPYSVFSDNCTIKEDSEIYRSVFGSDISVDKNTDIINSVISDNVKIGDHCSIDENCIIGYGCRVERFSRLLENCYLWPGRRVSEKSVLYDNVYFETPLKIEFNETGMSGKVNTQFTPHSALKIGEAAGSIQGVNRIGIGSDGNILSDYYKDICKSGISICGTLVYDYGEMVRSLVYFYCSYCSLDIFIYISMNGDIMNFSFFGKNGMPSAGNLENEINRIYRYSCFDYALTDNIPDCFNMNLFDTVYSSYLKKIFNGSDKISFSCESENPAVKNLFYRTFGKGKNDIKNNYQFLINYNSTHICVLYKDKFYSHARLISLISEIKFAEGRNITVPEDSPSFLEKTAEKYGCRVKRCFEYNPDVFMTDSKEILNNLWAFDAVFLCGELLSILDKGGCSLDELFNYQKEFSLRKNIIEYNCSDEKISSIINSFGMKKQNDGIYYFLEDKKGIARLRKLGNSHKIKLLVEASDIESAKELSAFISSKFDTAYIDKD